MLLVTLYKGFDKSTSLYSVAQKITIGDRGEMSEIALAISDEGRLAVVKRSENRVELHNGADSKDTRQVNITTKQNLIRPHDVCFALNNHLLITDVGDHSIKIYSLKNEEPQLVRIICYEKKAQAIIQMETPGGLLSALSSPDKYLTPFTVTVGPSPLSQIFAVFENFIFMITIDWNTVELMDYRRLSTPSDWTSVQCKVKKECDKTSIVNDHKDNHKVGGQNPLAVTKGQFCAMFYHVTERKRSKFNFKCLERKKCRVGKMTRPYLDPKADYAPTVVVYVRLTDQMGRLIFHARYGNCFEGERRNTIHAEYFMLVDEEFNQAVKLLGDQKEGKIEIYMNKQPCFRSTRRHHGKISGVKRKECAQDLVNFYNFYCLSHGIKLTINLCQFYKVDMLPSPSLEDDIQNARRGIQIMMSAGIELKAMTEESWRQLAGYADIELPEYTDSDRQKLDQHIAEFLQRMEPLAELPAPSVEVHSQSTQQ